MTTISELIDEYGEPTVTRAYEGNLSVIESHVTTEDLEEMVLGLNEHSDTFPELDWHENDDGFFDIMFDDYMTLIKAVQNADGYNVDDRYVQISQEGYLTSTDSYSHQLESKSEEIIDNYVFENVNGNLKDIPNVTAAIEQLLEEGAY